MPPHPAIATTAEIVAELKAGRMVILVDEEDRENEGDLVMAAEHITADAVNFMAKHGRGLICLTLTEARCKKLGLVQMARNNKTQYGTAFTVSIEAAEGVTTGISAADRALTMQIAVAKNTTADDIVQPGHVFPITAREGGVLVRAGHTEAGCDLAGMAGLEPSSVICEIMNDDGTMARLPELMEFAKEHGLKIGTIADLIHYRASGATHLALVRGTIPADGETLVRVHEPLSVLDFLDPASKQQSFSINEAQAALAKKGHGVIVLMHRPEDGEALLTRLTGQKPRAQTKWDPRTYGIGAQILRDLGVSKMRLLSSPRKMPSMTGFGLEVTGFVTSPAEL